MNAHVPPVAARPDSPASEDATKAHTLLANLVRPMDRCPICCGADVIKRGKRKKKNESVQLYLCKACGKTFTGLVTRGKSYPARMILDALSYYSVGFTAEQTRDILKKQYDLEADPTTIVRWSKEFADVCPYGRMREHGLRLFAPRQMILNSHMKHRQTYHYRYHQAKMILTLDEPKHFRFSALKDFLDSVIDECPHNRFQNAPRASEVKNVFSRDGVRIVEKVNTAIHIARMVMQAVTDNSLRHNALQKFMIATDSVTVATEVPVILDQEDIDHFREMMWELPASLTGPVTGHIDFVQVRNGMIHLLDLKLRARKCDPVDQLTLYALALSRLTGLKLKDFKCSWFDENDLFEFFPLHVVKKKKRRNRRKGRTEADEPGPDSEAA